MALEEEPSCYNCSHQWVCRIKKAIFDLLGTPLNLDASDLGRLHSIIGGKCEAHEELGDGPIIDDADFEVTP